MMSHSTANWLTTVALVLIVIGIALVLNAWREQGKHTGSGAQIGCSGVRHTEKKRA